MSSPEAIIEPPAKKKGGLWKIILVVTLLVVGGCVGLCAFSIFAAQGSMKMVSPAIQCMAELGLNHKAITAYAQANNDTLPPAENWQDEIATYYEKEHGEWKKVEDAWRKVPFVGMDIKTAPAGQAAGCGFGEPKTGFAYNQEVAGKKLADVSSSTPLLFEVKEAGYSAAASFVKAPEDQSPKFQGKPRGWFSVSIGGSIEAEKEFKRAYDQIEEAGQQIIEAEAQQG